MSTETLDLAHQSRARLDALFSSAQPGPVPAGRTRGTALIAAGSSLDAVLKPLIRALVWKGKMFRPATRDLKNLLSPFGVQGIRARVYEDTSWFDQRPAIIIDYSTTSFVAQMVRDEIRQIAPGLYLGQIFLGKKRVGHFMLEAPSQPATTPGIAVSTQASA
ncbi:MAG: hypothetical protein ACREL7_01970 [Longimicrobiales bacterium]